MSIASYSSSYACHTHQAVRQLCLVGRGIHCRCHTEARCVPRGAASFTSSSHLPPCNEPPFSRCCLCFSTTRNARVRRSYLSRSLRGRRYTRTPTRRMPSQWLLLTHAFNATLANLTRSRQSPLGTIAQLLYVHSTAATGRQSRRLGRHRHGNVFGFFGRHASFYRASHAFLPLVGTASASHRLYDLWRSTRAASTIATTASASASTASSTSITSSSTTSIPSARSHLRQNR